MNAPAYRRNSPGLVMPVCIAVYPDGTEIRMSFWSDDGLPPFDVAAGIRLVDQVYAGVVWRRMKGSRRTKGRTLASLDFHAEADFRRTFEAKGGRYEVYHPETGRVSVTGTSNPPLQTGFANRRKLPK